MIYGFLYLMGETYSVYQMKYWKNMKKTTVARIPAKIYKELGLLRKGHLVETDRSGLVAE